MTFFSILFALIAEQYRPVTSSHWIARICARWLDWVAGEFLINDHSTCFDYEDKRNNWE